MNKKLKYILIFILMSLLFVIRAFENELFYDPLIEYFHNDYLYAKMPEVNIWKLVVSTLYRYALNSLITIGVIRVVFGKKRFVKFASFFLMVAFMLLIVVFVFLV
ncbi:MAG: exosortase F-associated protein, partial [Polaribacter sp.]